MGYSYTIQKGDNLSTIVKKLAGQYSQENLNKIVSANGIKDPNLIIIGQTLNFPDDVVNVDAAKSSGIFDKLASDGGSSSAPSTPSTPSNPTEGSPTDSGSSSTPSTPSTPSNPTEGSPTDVMRLPYNFMFSLSVFKIVPLIMQSLWISFTPSFPVNSSVSLIMRLLHSM